MIPKFQQNGLLPPGIHWAGSLDEIRAKFATNPHREGLYDGLVLALQALKKAGVQKVYLDGSFTTTKPNPADYDACWDPNGLDTNLLDPTFRNFTDKRAAQKAKYGGEFFLAGSPTGPLGKSMLEFFQQTKDGEAKGIVEIDLGRILL